MRQAIITKYIGPTNYRGSRVKATCAAKSVTLPWIDSLNSDENHELAARELADSLGWVFPDYELVGGGMPDNRGNCYVFVKKT